MSIQARKDRKAARAEYKENVARVRAFGGGSPLMPAFLRIYSGPQPVSPDHPVPVDCRLLAEVFVKDGKGKDTVHVTGVATWFRVHSETHQPMCDSHISVMKMPTNVLVAGEHIDLDVAVTLFP